MSRINVNEISPRTGTNLTITGSLTITNGDISGQTGSFSGGLVLTSPDGTQYTFTTDNNGHLSITGSAI